MDIIALRGLPGSGKTELANRLAQNLNVEVLHVDQLKLSLKERFPEKEWPEIRIMAYDQAIEQIAKYQHQGIQTLVVEELFVDPSFVSALQDFCAKNEINLKFVRIERNIEQLLEVEKTRTDRVVKNSREDLENLEKQLHELQITGEQIIQNDGPLEEVLQKLEGNREILKELNAY